METSILAGTWLCFCFFLFYFEIISSCVMSHSLLPPFVWFPPLFAPHLSLISLLRLHLFCPLLCLPVPSSPRVFPTFWFLFPRIHLLFVLCFALLLGHLLFSYRPFAAIVWTSVFLSLFNKAPTCMCVFAFGSHFVESDKHIEHYARCIYVCLSVHLSVDRFRQGTDILIM